MVERHWYWLGLGGSLALLATAYFYFQQHLGLPPCPLCIFQRVALAGVAVLCVVGLVFTPKKIGARLLSFGITLFSMFGLALAGRQVWLQHLPADKVPECGPDLAFMLNAFPLKDVLIEVLSGSGECAQVQWQLLGLSMPEWMIIVFLVMVLISIRLLFAKQRSYFLGSHRR